MIDQKLPEPGSVWRRGPNDLREVVSVQLPYPGNTGVYVSFSPSSGIFQFELIDQWHTWAADAVQVWPVAEKGADE